MRSASSRARGVKSTREDIKDFRQPAVLVMMMGGRRGHGHARRHGYGRGHGDVHAYGNVRGRRRRGTPCRGRGSRGRRPTPRQNRRRPAQIFDTRYFDVKSVQRQAGQRLASTASSAPKSNGAAVNISPLRPELPLNITFDCSFLLLRAQCQAVDLGCQVARAVAVINVDGGNAVGARVDHRQQGRHAAEGRAVTPPRWAPQ